MSYYLFIDESGDHNLKSLEKGTPLFLLCGCVIDFDEAKRLEEEMRLFKIKHFGTADIILHYREIRKRMGYFSMLMNKDKNTEFLKDLKELLSNINYNIIVSIIDKEEHIKSYGKTADDPYELSLNFLIERFIFFINKDITSTKIIAEKRGEKEDKKLLGNWVKIYQRGTFYIKSKELQAKIDEFKMLKKTDNIAGLQLADIMASCIMRKFIKSDETEDIFETIKHKIIFYKNGCLGKGIKIFPFESKYKKTISSLI